MSVDPTVRRRIDALERLGYDCSPEGHETMICPCGYEGKPAHVLPYDEVSEVPGDYPAFVCPECGDA